MNKKTIKTLLHFLILFCFAGAVQAFAQAPADGSISAKVTDASTGETVPFASAVILNRQTKAVVKGAQSDANGNLNIVGIPAGIYTFKISYVGYQTMVRDSVAIGTTPVNLGTIKMKPSAGTVLNEVNVTAQRATMQLGIDKKVFSVDQSLVSEGGSASDLLQNVPSVQTDIDGNVSLRGSSGVRVLIDGKPSAIAGGNVAQILQSIPASSIETVELITNPSAKYDAEGQSGIINIVLKKNKKLGLNGSVALTAGNRDNYNGNASLSFQNGKINVYGNYGYRYGNRLGGGYSNVTYLETINGSNVITGFADQTTDSRSLDKNHNLKGGVDYTIDAKNVLSFSGGFNIRDNTQDELLRVDQLNASGDPINLSNRKNDNTRSGGSYDLSLDYSRKFSRPKEELTANVSFSEGTNDNFQFYSTDVLFGADGEAPLQTDGGGINRNYVGQIDYTLPIGETGTFEAGYRSQIRISDDATYADRLNEITGVYYTDLQLTNKFNNKDQVHALYLNFRKQVGNFGYQIGLRGEDARLDTRLGTFDYTGALNYTPGKVDYTRIYPSVFLTQKFKGEQQVQLSYSRRVNRPRGWDTNPFLDVSDQLNYRRGNPNLRPEDVHAFELSYSKYWSKVTLTSSAYLRQTNDVIQRVRTLYEEIPGVTLTTPQNLTRSINSGLELIGRVDVAKAWNFTGNVNLYQAHIDAVPEFGLTKTSGFSWNANLTNNFVLPYGVTLQIKGDYRAPEVMSQGKRNAMYAVDAGAKYDFKNKRSSLSLNVRDVFNTRNWSMTTTADNTTIDFKRRMQGTMANLTYSYRFGQTDFKPKRSRKPETQDMGSGEEPF
ncbi:TonB-dependent receptor domain-containing protein [Pedobacter deserti]|uniref:TonB-dependent receptor domain-containing protein n=1 Tax=Pedobacter deserti TaxID=2817382 RepID=UPI00210C8CAC|nr:TonB-dependent receptor [Pedobacter sp. SYSU D00382]